MKSHTSALARDFKSQVGDKSLHIFLYQHKITSINKNPTPYKTPNNPSCIDHNLANSLRVYF